MLAASEDKMEVQNYKNVNEYNPKEILGVLEQVLEEERANLCYFDLTGGEDLILAAMGMLSERYQIPLHKYDVEHEKLYNRCRVSFGTCYLL